MSLTSESLPSCVHGDAARELAAGCSQLPSAKCPARGFSPGQHVGGWGGPGLAAASAEPRSVGTPCLLPGRLGSGRPGGSSWLSARSLLSPQRLKDEIAEVTNEIENLGSTEER